MMETNNKPPRLAKVRAALAYAHLGKTRLYDLINSGDIIAKKRGKRETMIDLDSIDAYHNRLERIQPKEKSK